MASQARKQRIAGRLEEKATQSSPTRLFLAAKPWVNSAKKKSSTKSVWFHFTPKATQPRKTVRHRRWFRAPRENQDIKSMLKRVAVDYEYLRAPMSLGAKNWRECVSNDVPYVRCIVHIAQAHSLNSSCLPFSVFVISLSFFFAYLVSLWERCVSVGTPMCCV